jgi:hypothetical protein
LLSKIFSQKKQHQNPTYDDVSEEGENEEAEDEDPENDEDNPEDTTGSSTLPAKVMATIKKSRTRRKKAAKKKEKKTKAVEKATKRLTKALSGDGKVGESDDAAKVSAWNVTDTDLDDPMSIQSLNSDNPNANIGIAPGQNANLTGHISFRALKSIEKGEEMVIEYSQASNLEFLIRYGFTVDGNPFGGRQFELGGETLQSYCPAMVPRFDLPAGQTFDNSTIDCHRQAR